MAVGVKREALAQTVWVVVQCSFVEMAQERQPRKAGLGDRQPVSVLEIGQGGEQQGVLL